MLEVMGKKTFTKDLFLSRPTLIDSRYIVCYDFKANVITKNQELDQTFSS